MAGGNIVREDIRHEDIVDAVEAASDGVTSIIFTGATVVSTTNVTKTVVLSGIDLQRDPDIVEPGDIVVLSGNAAAGTYTIDQRIDDTSFTVNETIADSTGGLCEARNPSGAARIGVDATGLTYITKTNLQEVIEEIDPQLAGGGGGEVNTASNVGGEVGVFKQKTGANLEFRTLDEDGGLNISEETDTVRLSTGFRRHFLTMGG
jgi:hypothetical protein